MTTDRLTEIVDEAENCLCGYGPGMACHPDCPAYKPPPPAKIEGKVRIDHAVKTNEEAADYGSYSRWEFATTDPPVAILRHDDKRARALVWATVGTVLLGSRKQVVNGQGILITTTTAPVPISNKQELWAVGSGGAATVNVINERWE